MGCASSRTRIGLALALGLGLVGALLGALAGRALEAQAQGSGCYHVAPSCTGIPDCYTTLQAAVDAASDDADSGRAATVIKVAAGVYTDLHPAVVDYRTITQVVYVYKSVAIQGGYTLTDWTEPDPLANPTVLDARGLGRALYVAGLPELDKCISPTIEGLSITGGDAAGLGGGPLGEDSGAGAYVAADSAVIGDCRVFGNDADYGGGLYLGDGVATLSDNTVASNTAEYGGGLFAAGVAATLWHNDIISNVAGYGGGVFLSSQAAALNGNTIAANAAITGGGGLLLVRSEQAVLDGNVVVDNSAGVGGGLYVDRSDATLANTVVADNRADSVGSGLYVVASSPQLLHSTIARNIGGVGSGLYVTGSMRGATYYPSVVALTNTILVSHTLGIAAGAGNTATLEATLWGAGGWANGADWGGAGTVNTGTPGRNYWGLPDFAVPGAGDYHLGLASDGLDRGVDAGVAQDMDGQPRPQGSSYDLGADETGLVAIKRASSDRVAPGAPLHYAIHVTNTSVVTLTATITDRLPDGVTPGGLLTWMPVTIAPGGAWTHTVALTVDAGYAGTLTNVVWVTTDEGPDGTYAETCVASYVLYLPLILRAL